MKTINQIKNKVMIYSIIAYIALIACIIISIILLQKDINLIFKALYVFIIDLIAAISIHISGRYVYKGLLYLINNDIFKGMNQEKYLDDNNAFKIITVQKFYAISTVLFILIHIYLTIWAIIVTGIYTEAFNGIFKYLYKILYTVAIFWFPYLINFSIAIPRKNISKIIKKLNEMEKDTK